MRGPTTAVIARKKAGPLMMKGGKAKASEKSSSSELKSSKDLDAPKRPPTAFFFFMEEFRKHFKENFPDNKSVAAVSKAGGMKWKSLSDSDKAPYTEKALKKKAQYEEAMISYKKNKTLSENEHNEKSVESEKSTCESNDTAAATDEQEATASFNLSHLYCFLVFGFLFIRVFNSCRKFPWEVLWSRLYMEWMPAKKM